MRKYSLPVRIAALLCALCLLLTGCGQVAAPGGSAQSAAEETPSALENLERTEGEDLADIVEAARAAREELKKAQRAAAGARTAQFAAQFAAQLAAEHLGQGVPLTNVVDFSVDDFDGNPCHVLMLKDAYDRFLAYSYDTETAYCFSYSEVGNFHDQDWSTDEGRCQYLLSRFFHHTRNYCDGRETRTELTAAEVEQVNLALRRGEIPADVAAEWTAAQEKEKAAQEQLEAARRAAIEAQAASLTDAELQAARLTAEYLRQDAALTDVVDFAVDYLWGDYPCHALLLKSADDEFLAYSYDTETAYCPSSDEVRRGTEDYSTEENRCLALLSAFAYHVSGSVDNYWGPDETRIELTPSEIEEVNLALSRGEVPEDAEEEEEITIGARAAQLAAEYLGEDTTLTDVVDFSEEDFVYGIPCHALLLKSADDKFLAYGYDTETVYCPSSDEVWNYESDAWTTDWSVEENRCLYLLRTLAIHASGENDIYVSSEETRTELTAAEVKQVNLVLRQGSITEEVKAAQDELKAARQAAISVQAAQLAAEHLGEDTVLTNVEDVSLENFGGAPCHVLLLKDENDRFLAYNYDSEAVYCPASSEVRSFFHVNDNDIFRTEKTQYIYLLRQFFNHTGDYLRSGETLTALTAEEVEQANWVLAGEDVPSAVDDAALAALEMKAAQLTVAAIKAQAGQMDSKYLDPDTILPEGSGAYKVLDECPEKLARRELSDEEILSLAQEGDLEMARERISTGGDFAAWLIALGGQFCSGVTSDGVKQKTVGADFSFEWARQHLDSTMAASMAVRVLGDDLPGIGVVAARLAENDGTFLCGNLIPAEDGYYLISFDTLTDEWKSVIREAFLPIWVDGFVGIAAWCLSADNPRGSTLTQAFYISGD